MIVNLCRGFVLALLCTLIWVQPNVARQEPDKVVVQHVLIGIKGKVANKQISRSKKEARSLAYEILDRAEAGEDFDAMVKEYTDDRYPGRYVIINRGVSLLPGEGEYKRDDLAIKFGDLAFRLDVGEFGMATFHAVSSPYGYHVIKRLEGSE
jgi:parvulin-like peptidyl-prolyl isomerase